MEHILQLGELPEQNYNLSIKLYHTKPMQCFCYNKYKH